MNLNPFTVSIPDEEIEQLKQRLRMTRWPDEIPGAEWDYGIPISYMKDMVHYWLYDFDWRMVERHINSFSHYKAMIDGKDIHFVYEKGKGSRSIPILIPHGWPSTFYEMLDLIPFLTQPDNDGGDESISFDIIIPSIPGHGFSSIPLESGYEDRQVANVLVKLMEGLGYEQFGAHGYDLGASVLGLLCLDHPERVIGYHTTSPGNPSPCIGQGMEMSEAERAFLTCGDQWYREEGGYAHLLGTKPQTAAYALHDSPVGLAAFILEKWYYWTVFEKGESMEQFSKDDLLANVSIYWFTQTINAANRYYYEGRHIKWPGEGDICTVPHGVSLTKTQPHERPPREYVARLFPNILQWDELNAGGHFVALEQPELVASQIRSFFSKIDKQK
ncbi:epoxide hydrolase family protein [Paenibacillus sp.]|uniref:epoxide hydrolase family protein n=1 Tax=Paenibacillus sp. TaxID=58172 RepID=UPI00346498FF